MKDVFLDRIGIALNADTEPLSMEERVQAVAQVLEFSEGSMNPNDLAEVHTLPNYVLQ
jgi:Mg-chelatase subunit ChlI